MVACAVPFAMHLNTPSTVQLGVIAEGSRGIYQTLRIMNRLVRDGKRTMRVREKAMQLVQACGPGNARDYKCQVKALHQFVRDNIRYVMDITDTETIATPDKTLELGAGDCDDKSVLLAALLESIGHPTAFIAIGFEPGVFSHVYVESKIGTVWVPLETTEAVPVGWSPDAVAIVEKTNPFYN